LMMLNMHLNIGINSIISLTLPGYIIINLNLKIHIEPEAEPEPEPEP
jgi:hypothetical protein